MKKVISIIIPYLIAGMTLLMSFPQFDYKNVVIASLIGLLVGIWILCSIHVEGTRLTLRLLWGTFILLVIGDVVTFMYLKDMLPVMIFTTVIQLFMIYLIYKNKPRISMTYKYSFKNKKRRYF